MSKKRPLTQRTRRTLRRVWMLNLALASAFIGNHVGRGEWFAAGCWLLMLALSALVCDVAVADGNWADDRAIMHGPSVEVHVSRGDTATDAARRAIGEWEWRSGR